jgi:hypothetical protein
MPLIKARTNRVRIVRHISRLQEPNRDALLLYARFIGDTADHVLNQLLETVLAKDREFVAWRAEHPEEVLAPPERRLGPEPPRSAPAALPPAATTDPR